MKIEVIRKNNIDIAIVNSDETLITDVSSALDLIMTILYETNCTNIAIRFFCFKHLFGRRNIAKIY